MVERGKMGYLNQVSIIGRMAHDPFQPKDSKINKGQVYIDFVVFNNRYSPEAVLFGEPVELPEPIRIQCRAVDKIAMHVYRYCSKGDLVQISGKIMERNFRSMDGKKVYANYIYVESISFLQTEVINDPNFEAYKRHIETIRKRNTALKYERSKQINGGKYEFRSFNKYKNGSYTKIKQREE